MDPEIAGTSVAAAVGLAEPNACPAEPNYLVFDVGRSVVLPAVLLGGAAWQPMVGHWCIGLARTIGWAGRSLGTALVPFFIALYSSVRAELQQEGES